MTRRTGSIVVLILLLPALTGCGRSSSQLAKAAEKPPVAVEIATVAPGDLDETISVVGTLAPKFQGDVKAEYSGVISEVYVSEWVPVKRGALLARFDSREIQAALKRAQADRAQAEVGVTRAKRELERCEKLRAGGLATQQTLDDARSAAEAAEAQLAAAVAQEDLTATRLRKTEIRSPMAGVVALRTVNPGDFIENMGSPRPMFRIVDNNRLELTVTVPSTRLEGVSIGQPIAFSVDALPGRRFEGRVSYVNPALDDASRTMKVVAEVTNRDGALKSGMFVRGDIVTGTRRGVLRIPRTALVTWDQATGTGSVYVVEDGKARRKSVTVGGASAEAMEISSGLTAGETVVARGAFDVRDGDRVSVASATGA